MKKISIILVFAMFAFYCGSKPEVKDVKKVPKKPAVPSVTSFSASQIIDRFNVKLEGVSLNNFPAWKSAVPQQELNSWAEMAKPAINEVIKVLPANYVLQITGHASKEGPRGKNIAISKKRAYYVYKAFKNTGINVKLVKYKGVGYANLANPDNPTGAENRRVTFKIVKK